MAAGIAAVVVRNDGLGKYAAALVRLDTSERRAAFAEVPGGLSLALGNPTSLTVGDAGEVRVEGALAVAAVAEPLVVTEAALVAVEAARRDNQMPLEEWVPMPIKA